MFDCRQCDEGTRRARTCPDLGLRREADNLIPFGGLGDERQASARLPICPGWYKRHPSEYENLPWAVDSRSVYDVAIETKWAIEQGAARGDVRDLPAALHDAVLVIAAEEAHVERLRHDKAMAKASRPQGQRVRHIDGVGLVED